MAEPTPTAPSDYKLLLVHSVRSYSAGINSVVISESSSVATFKTEAEANAAIATIDHKNQLYKQQESDYQNKGFNRTEYIDVVKLY